MQTFYDEADEMKVGVPDLNKDQEVDDMAADETADNDTSLGDMVVDASGDLNPTHHCEVVPIDGERTDKQVIDMKKINDKSHSTRNGRRK